MRVVPKPPFQDPPVVDRDRLFGEPEAADPSTLAANRPVRSAAPIAVVE
jgi:hypothetical protein